MNIHVPKPGQEPAQVAVQNFHESVFDTPEARKAASELSNEKRQELVLNLLVRYPRFETGYRHVSATHRPVKGGAPRKGGVACLLGDTRAGKTSIVKAYMAEHPPYVGELGEVFPMAYVATTASASTSTITDSFYQATGARAMAPSLNVTTRTMNVISRLAILGTELVVLDDVQYMVAGRRSDEVNRFSSFVRSLIDAKMFAIQLIGEEKPVLNWMRSRPEISGRGFRHEVIRPFDRTADGQIDHQILMSEIDDRLPFRQPSELGNAAVAAELYDYSDGYLGRTVEMLREACWKSISNGDTRILFSTLQETCREMAWRDDQPDFFGREFTKRYRSEGRR